jgi:PAS domain S-box-containing protein
MYLLVPTVPEQPAGEQVSARAIAHRALRARPDLRSPLIWYVFSFALVIAAGAIRVALGQRASYYSPFPFLLFYPAIIAASFFGGTGPGMFAIFLAGAFAGVFFPQIPSPESWLALVVLSPLLVVGLTRLRYIRERGRAAVRELADFKFTADHANDWILLLGEAGNIRYANLQACADLGWTERELAGRHIESLVQEAQRPGLRALLKEANSGGTKPIELRFESRDKSVALRELGCTAVRTGQDQVIYAAARDIGERNLIERRLHEVRHWESLGVLAGGLAHDFNNRLTSILGNASLAKESVPAEHIATPMLEGIISASERSAELVRMLLAISGYRSRYREVLQLAPLLDAVLEKGTLPLQIQVRKNIEAAEFPGDRRSFEVLLWSLISNAAEAYATAEGEVRISIRFGRQPHSGTAGFDEGDAGSGECLGIVVEDEGPGMGPEVLERAFDPFFSTKFTGRGLGLAAVRGIVRSYEGKLLLESAPGRGTRVEVWLPRQ